jgi:hypothetical protein
MLFLTNMYVQGAGPFNRSVPFELDVYLLRVDVVFELIMTKDS